MTAVRKGEGDSKPMNEKKDDVHLPHLPRRPTRLITCPHQAIPIRSLPIDAVRLGRSTDSKPSQQRRISTATLVGTDSTGAVTEVSTDSALFNDTK